MKRPLVIAISFFLLIPLTSLAAEERLLTVAIPKYSQIKKLSNAELEKQLAQFTGTPDTWKNNTPFLSRIKSFIPFKKKMTLEEERKNLSYLHARRNPGALKEMALTIQNSRYPEIRGIYAIIQGDKALAKQNYLLTQNYDLYSLLYFFKTLEYGDTGLETKKFQEFALGFERLAYDINLAYQRASALNLPMVLEFESSALLRMSPLTLLLYRTIVDDPTHILKMEITPDAGRLISIHPFYAKDIAKNVDMFADQLSKKVKTLRGKLFKDPEAKQRLTDLLKYGEGWSGVLYTDERIQELSIQEKRKLRKMTCANLFND